MWTINSLSAWILNYVCVSSLILCVSDSSKCQPLPQDQENILEFKLGNISLDPKESIFVHSADNLIAKCNYSKVCHDYYTDKYKTSMYTHNSTKEIAIVISMFQMIKHEMDEKTINWHIIYKKNVVHKKCYTYIFSPVTNVLNSRKIVSDELNMTCRSTHAVTKIILCEVSISFETYTNTCKGIIYYLHNQILDDLIKSLCAFVLPKANLSEGILLTISPYVSTFDDDKDLNASDVFPSNQNYNHMLLKDCFRNDKENEELSCACRPYELNNFDFTASWHFKKRSENETNILSFKVKIEDMQYAINLSSITYNTLDLPNNETPALKSTRSQDKKTTASESNVLMMVAYFCGGNIILFMIVVLIVYHRKRGSHNILDICITCPEKKKNVYDEINDGYVLPDDQLYHTNSAHDTGEYMNCGQLISTSSQSFECKSEEQGYEIIDDDIIVHVNGEENGNEMHALFPVNETINPHISRESSVEQIDYCEIHV